MACPTNDDVASGVRITFDDQAYSIITRDSSGAVNEVEIVDGDSYVYESEHGVFESGYIENGERDTFSYDFDTANMIPLKPWSRATGQQTVRDESGDVIEVVGFSYHTLGERPFLIGDCTYNAIKVQTYYQFEDHQSMVELTFLIDLGIPINTAYRANGVVDLYRPVSIIAE